MNRTADSENHEGDGLADLFAATRGRAAVPAGLEGSIRAGLRASIGRRRARWRHTALSAATAVILMLVMVGGLTTDLGSDANLMLPGSKNPQVYTNQFGRWQTVVDSPEELRQLQQQATDVAMDAGRPSGLTIIDINGGHTAAIGREVVVDGERIERARRPRDWEDTIDHDLEMKWLSEFTDEVENLANDPDADYLGWEIFVADGIPFKVHFWAKDIPGLGHVILGDGPPLIPFD